MAAITRPSPSEHAPYYSRYIDLVPQGDIFEILSQQSESFVKLLSTVGNEKAEFRYALGKWIMKEVVGHVIDTERVFAFRAFAFTRDRMTPLPGMDQEIYAAGANYTSRPLEDIVDEYRDVRRSTILLFRSFTPEMFAIRGTASGFEFSVRCLPFIIAGHELHHRQVLVDRYLKHA